ncbi:MAG: metallophosphoesterase family protein [Alphaproteobacteria bacterium]
MLKKIYKIFFACFLACLITSLSLLCLHIYFGDKTSDIGAKFFPPQSEFLTPEKSEFSIAVVSDTGADDIVLETIIDHITSTKPKYDFILHLGDFLTHRTNTGLQWLLYEIHPKLNGIPLYGTPGNHDITKNNKRDATPYKTVMGPGFYWFGYGHTLFIALDTSFETIDDAQLNWLDNTLKKIRPLFKHCVIFTHVPPFDIRPDIISNHTLDKSASEKLEHILKNYNIDMMIFGHVHYYSHNKFAGIPIYTVPSSGQTIRDPRNKYGYVHIEFDKTGLKTVTPKYIDFHGTKREYIEYTIARDIFHYKLRETISYIMIPGLIFFVLGFITFIITKIVTHKKLYN